MRLTGQTIVVIQCNAGVVVEFLAVRAVAFNNLIIRVDKLHNRSDQDNGLIFQAYSSTKAFRFEVRDKFMSHRVIGLSK